MAGALCFLLFTMNHNRKAGPPGNTRPGSTRRPANVYPIEDFLEIQRLMKRLGLSPADCLSILLGVLLSYEEAERDREAAQGLDVPLWVLGYGPTGN